MARNLRSSSAKKTGSLKLLKLDFSRAKKRVQARLKKRMQLAKMSLGELHLLVETEEQKRMKKALLCDPLEEARKNLLERAKALFPKLDAIKPASQVTKSKKPRTRERKMPLHFVLKPRK